MTKKEMINRIKYDTETKLKNITGNECFIIIQFGREDSQLEQLKIVLCNMINAQVRDVFIKRKRIQEYVWVRNLYIQILKKCRPHYSLAQMGRTAGGLNHATVIHSLKTHNALYEFDKKYKIFYDSLMNRIEQNYPQLISSPYYE